MIRKQPPLCLTCIIAAALFSTPLAQQQAPVFRAETAVVPVYVSVTGPDGRSVQDLTREEFEILHEGKRVDVALFAAGAEPIAIKVLIDNGRDIAHYEGQIARAGRILVNALRAGDRMGISTFSAIGSPFTDDKRQLRDALEKAWVHRLKYSDFYRELEYGAFRVLAGAAWGFTADVNRMGVPIALIGSAWKIPSDKGWSPGPAAGSRAIVVFSAGMDEREKPPARQEYRDLNDRFERELIRGGFVIFGVGFKGPQVDRRLRRVAEESGGWFLHPKRGTKLPEAMKQIVADLHERYLLGFTPPAADGQDHAIEVRVTRPGLTVRSRAMYQAPPDIGWR